MRSWRGRGRGGNEVNTVSTQYESRKKLKNKKKNFIAQNLSDPQMSRFSFARKTIHFCFSHDLSHTHMFLYLQICLECESHAGNVGTWQNGSFSLSPDWIWKHQGDMPLSMSRGPFQS